MPIARATVQASRRFGRYQKDDQTSGQDAQTVRRAQRRHIGTTGRINPQIATAEYNGLLRLTALRNEIDTSSQAPV